MNRTRGPSPSPTAWRAPLRGSTRFLVVEVLQDHARLPHWAAAEHHDEADKPVRLT